MERNTITRRTVVVVPYNMDVRANKQRFVDCFAKGGADVEHCALVVAACGEDQDRAQDFCDEIGSDFAKSYVVVCNEVYSNMDCNTKDVSITAERVDSEFAKEREKYIAGEISANALEERERNWKLRSVSFRQRCGGAGVFAAKLFREAIMQLYSWSDSFIEQEGFDPKDSGVLLVSEDGTQVPNSPNFFRLLEFEANRDPYTRFRVPYIYDFGRVNGSGIRNVVVGSVYSPQLLNFVKVFDGMQISSSRNWREQLTSYFMDSYTCSDVMRRVFRIEKDKSSHVTENGHEISTTSDISSGGLTGGIDSAERKGEVIIDKNGGTIFRDIPDSPKTSRKRSSTGSGTIIKRKK